MPADASALYVAPDGADANPGTRAKPFATPERARDELRALRKAGALPKGAVGVELAAGTYERARPFELAAEDSGSQDAPIVYRARKGEEVRITGGRRVAGWQPVADKAVLDRLDPAARGNLMQADLKALGIADFGSPGGGGIELFFNDQPMQIARWPNDGFVKITGLVEPDTVNVRGTKGSKTGKFMFDGDRPKRWAGEKEPWVHGYWFWDWSDQRHAVESLDTEKRVIAVKPPYHGYGYRVGQWFYAFNLISEIDRPGEWCLDRQAGILYFWPPSPIAKGRAVVSVAESLVAMKGASHVTLRGLILENCRGTAVAAQGGSHVQVVGCTLRNLGGYAVRIADAADSRVLGCDISETGDGGISLAGGDRTTLTPARLVAENNHIHHYGRWNRMYKAAIHLSGVGNRAAHNLIHNAPHMAIGFSGNDHTIEFNEIHSVCHESNDAGAMYAGRNWTMRGTVVRHNYLHHINGFQGRGCVGVYLDDMFCGTEIVGNVFYKVTRAAFVGGGRDCTVANNLFVDCPRALHIDSRALGWAKYHAETWVKEGTEKGTHLGIRFKEPPYSTRYPKLVNVLDDEPFAPKGNVVERNIFVGQGWNDVDGRAKSYVVMKDNLADTDPLFVGKPPASFELRKDSPAWKLGFQRIPVEEIGLYKDENRASWPVEHTARPMVELPAPKPRVPQGPPPIAKLPTKIVIEQGIHGEKLSPSSTAMLTCDGAMLGVRIDNAVDPKKPLRPGSTWGQDDAVEVAIRNPAAGKAAPIFVLRGFPNGHFESSAEAGAPEAVAKKAGEAVKFAAKVIGKDRWTAEYLIPFAALGIDPAKHKKLEFNLTVRKTAAPAWLMWRGTGGYSWEVAKAGLLELAP
ncbi:MAG TPA: right-handed parallel beta-helix repeat-containing protein [Planctomycetota bacterium]|nr:right-handed parallel beta-helix repeat-containing protein [Planctomycetota bacterium]